MKICFLLTTVVCISIFFDHTVQLCSIVFMLVLQDEECVNGHGEAGEALDALLADLAKVNNSKERASKLFQWLINPIPVKSFFRYI